ncbi:histone deacetylase family protein [Pontivivens nitratireducens]|uniref:Histone deacetylase family protein n=1 Tax=Pontivivens nitratireducens TaxID=2758038 RepID=A0A6G7VJJ0_9RHOB|nr:histone deacetylase family protein [Pontibrevibacter nitratireducens]QIK40191.1 histone deacetylase family protein [Pontibrevibacter nitratireducens]
MTVLFTHPSSLDHATPEGHPERAARVEAILKALAPFDTLNRKDAPEVTDAALLRVHPQRHIDAITAASPVSGLAQLDADTWMSPGSLRAARHAAGGAIAAVDEVLSNGGNAFVAMRPPGHHAEKTTPMGFCLFGNVAAAAKHALDMHGLARVAIVDFDVHHGNGTQDLLWDEERVLFISSHQMPLWPGTGDVEERGAHGNIMNVPLPPESGGAQMREAYESKVFPALEAYRPDLLILSAGFDAHKDDPLANLNWTTADFVWLTQALCDIAARHCEGRIVSILEGGYDLDALAEAVAAHVNVLIEKEKR